MKKIIAMVLCLACLCFIGCKDKNDYINNKKLGGINHLALFM